MSMTALVSAFARAYHTRREGAKIFDDNGLDLHEFVPHLTGVSCGGVHQRTTVPFAVAGLQNAHNRQLYGAAPRFLKTKKTHRCAVFLVNKAGFAGGICDILLRSGRNAEPLRQLRKDRAGDLHAPGGVGNK